MRTKEPALFQNQLSFNCLIFVIDAQLPELLKRRHASPLRMETIREIELFTRIEVPV